MWEEEVFKFAQIHQLKVGMGKVCDPTGRNRRECCKNSISLCVLILCLHPNFPTVALSESLGTNSNRDTNMYKEFIQTKRIYIATCCYFVLRSITIRTLSIHTLGAFCVRLVSTYVQLWQLHIRFVNTGYRPLPASR